MFIPVTVVSLLSLVTLGACSIPGASADPATSAESPTQSADSALVDPSPTPTVVSTVPFPLDPEPTPTPQVVNAAPETQNSAPAQAAPEQAAPAQQSTNGEHEGHDGEGEHEGHESGEFSERGSLQRIAVTVTSLGIQIDRQTVTAGAVEFDLTNQTQSAVDILITGNDVSGDTGMIAPGATVHLQGLLPPGRYTIALSSDGRNDGTTSVTLQVQ